MVLVWGQRSWNAVLLHLVLIAFYVFSILLDGCIGDNMIRKLQAQIYIYSSKMVLSEVEVSAT